MDKVKNINFADFDEGDWMAIRESRFPSAGYFQKDKGRITNFIPKKTSERDLYNAKDGVGFTLRLLKNLKMYNGRLELELKLNKTAAPSIYFRTQTEGDVHKETYNLVIFSHTAIKPGYQGVNLYKWKKNGPIVKKKAGKEWLPGYFLFLKIKKLNLWLNL